MPFAAWQATIVDESGDTQELASIEVRREATGALAAIYSDRDGSTPISNPFNADSDGFARFYTAGGAFQIVATLGDFSRTWRHVPIGLAGEYDALPSVKIRYDQTPAEIAAGVTPADYSDPPYNRARYASWADWKAACDQADEEGVVNGTWALTANIELPKKCKFTGTLTGDFEVLYQRRLNGWVDGLACQRVRLRGILFCRFLSLYAQYVDIDGYDNNWGTFWNEFLECHVDLEMIIDITNFSVNLNAFRGGRIGFCNITGDGSIYSGTEAHGNTFDAIDFTNGSGVNRGLLQDDFKMQMNFLRSCYYESGSTITGNFFICGYQGDANGLPLISRFAHILGTTGVNQQLSRDFLSLSPINSARGGNWDILDASGKPQGLTQAGGTSVAVVTDSTEPCGMGRRYEATFADAFDSFSITMQPTGSNRFGLLLFYKSTDDFNAVESNDGSGSIAHSATPVVVATPWKMLRISGPASATNTTSVTLFAYAGTGGAAKVMSIGGFFAGGERAIPAPSKPDVVYRYGSATYDPGSLADGAGVTTTVTVTGAEMGFFARASFTNDLQGITLTAWVSAANTVSVRFQNESGGVLDLASGTLRVQLQETFA